MSNEAKFKIDRNYIVIFAIAVLVSWISHEFAHWIAGELLGYKMEMTLNSTFPAYGQYSRDLHYQIISAAGPLLTLLEAIAIYFIMKQENKPKLYPFLFTCFYMRLFAAIISFRRANDEARISSALGIGKFTLPVIVSLILFMLIYKTTKAYKFALKFNMVNFGLAILFSSVIILTDMYLRPRLL